MLLYNLIYFYFIEMTANLPHESSNSLNTHPFFVDKT